MANKTNAYFKWRKAFIRDDRLSSSTKLLLHALHVYMKDDTLEAFPSRATLAEDTGLNERSISRLTKKAEALGWIKKFRVKQKGNQFFNNIYKGTYPNHGYVCTPRGDPCDQSRVLNDTQGVTQSPTNYPCNYLYNSSNNKNNDSIEPELDAKEKRFSVIDVGEEVTIRESQVKTKSQLIHTILGLRNQYARDKVFDWVFKNDLSEVRSREELKS